MLCSNICIVSGNKLVPGIQMYRTYHLECTLAQESTPHCMWRRYSVIDALVLNFLFPLTNQKPRWHIIYLLRYLLQQTYSWNTAFSNWGKKGNKTMPTLYITRSNEQLQKHTKIWVLGLAFHGSENEWNFNWIQTFPCVPVDNIYYCNCKGQVDASMFFNEIF